MALREIILYPDELLRIPAEEIRTFDAELSALVEDMFETMYAAPGVGLAAPQIGLSGRVLVMDPSGRQEPDAARALVNPAVTWRSDETLVTEEGCLSIPGYYAEVSRPAAVRIEARDPDGERLDLELEGFPAIVAQHEIDHLDGILFVDYLSRTRWRLFERQFGRDPYRWKYAAARA